MREVLQLSRQDAEVLKVNDERKETPQFNMKKNGSCVPTFGKEVGKELGCGKVHPNIIISGPFKTRWQCSQGSPCPRVVFMLDAGVESVDVTESLSYPDWGRDGEMLDLWWFIRWRVDLVGGLAGVAGCDLTLRCDKTKRKRLNYR